MKNKIRIAVMLFLVVLLAGCSQFTGDEADTADTAQNEATEEKPSDEITITFTSNGDNNWTIEENVKIGDEFGELAIPEKSGYVFKGWYDREISGLRILKGQTIEFKSDTTLYGQWIEEDEYDDETGGMPILMYHWFYEGEPDHEQTVDNNWMPIDEFTEQMQYLHEEGYYFPSWDEVEMYIDGKLSLPEKSIVVTVDDGKKNFFDLGIPVIHEYDIDVTSFLITSKIKKSKIEKYTDDNIQFASHSDNFHIRGDGGIGVVTTMTVDEITEDLQKSKEKVNQTKVFCYPFGHTSQNLKDALTAEDFTMAVTIKHGYVHPGTDKLMLPRVRMDSGMTLETYKNLITPY